ncbi:24-hydroxycholesterol 7-alpha-hydroxylase isoform X2 [Microtus pennsylvanicus]|uniref:24-hydroxycholesterol 7-alpha-hydroxylase isoform X2 n=1 Tax=Microtus pennsylvanicus TaxID=10058 RepID=UPI003F6C6B55
MGVMEFFSPVVITVLGSCVLFLFFRWKNLRGPPCIQGWVPWIGAGFEFGKAPLEFIEKARIKYGPIFTIFAMGKRMTFVTEEEGINVFLKSKHVDFELAVQNPVYNAAWIPKNVFFSLHEKLYVLMKGKMGTFSTHQFTGQLSEAFHEQLEDLGARGTVDLNDFVRHLLYPATVNTLFKKGLFPTDERKIKEFYQHFKTYDEGFEYGSQLPEWLLRNWSKSKRWLLTLFEKSIDKIKAHESVAGHSRIAFWTLAFVLAHPEVHKTVLEAISSVFGTTGKDKIKVSDDDLKKLLLIKWCVLEAIRLRAPGIITRKVVKPIKILSHTVPPGDLLMVSPFWLHRNPKYFLEPDSFKPERWKEANLDKNAFLDGFMAFGGGKFQCPGRWFALLEIQICIILVLYKYDCSLLDPLPKQSCLHLVGVPQPEGRCRIEYKQRT